MSPRTGNSSRAVLREWWLLLAFLCALATLTQQQGWLERLNATFYDAAISLYQRDLSEDIVIIAVDEDSLSEIGRWPWQRAVYAQLLDRLTAAEAKAIGLDLILSEPDANHPADDVLLGEAIKRNGHVVLPVFAEPLHGILSETEPTSVIAKHAAALGHIQSNLDVDGVARRVFLRCGMGHPHHPQFALAMLQVSGFKQDTHETTTTVMHNAEASAWYCAESYNIPFAGPPGSVRQFSASALLHGEVPATEMRGKLVLIGATAAGLGDAYPTPVSGESYAMPGVEINAHLIDSLRSNLSISSTSTLTKWLYAVLPVTLLMVAFLFLLPRRALLLTGSMILGLLFASACILRWPGFWFPPAEALLVLILSYPLWSWRKLEAGMHYLSDEIAELDRESAHFSNLTPRVQAAVAQPRIFDPVGARIEQVRQAAREVRMLRLLVNQSVISQSVGLLVVDADMKVCLVNPTLLDFLGQHEIAELNGKSTNQVLKGFVCQTAPDWSTFLRGVSQGQVSQCETRNEAGRDFLASVTSVENFGWVINLDDVTKIKAHERERSRLLNFLSHDMRAPQASILALLEQHADKAVADARLLQDIRGYAQRTLHLVSQFMYLARAENLQTDSFVALDMVQCMHDAIDEVWPQANARNVSIRRPSSEESMTVFGDPTLLRRALINLISNAVQHSPAGAAVTCDVSALGGEICCSVQDNGEGIRAEDQSLLFQTFSRIARNQHHDGTGLGLAMVKMVAEKHSGHISVQSAPGQGAIFFVYLNMATGISRR
ncbi:MAG: CHASE2 domain-containing protein [Gallionella sp.]|nr:CHASE2 domain-containing protein [Gallionella sp.]